MPMYGPQAARHFADYRTQALDLAFRYQSLSQTLAGHIQTAKAEVDAAGRALAQAYLGDLSAQTLAEAERLSGFRGFSRRDPLQAMAREKHVLQQTIARIVGDERYLRREYLVGSAGELTLALDEARSLLDPWERECATFEELPGFLELVEVGYDTPAFAVHFWESRYWKLWATGDKICRALDMHDFGDDVRPAYDKVELERRRWRLEVARAEAKVDEVHDLVQTHDQSVARIPDLPRIYLDGCHQVLQEHLQYADPQLLAQWLGDDEGHRPIRLALRRFAGAVNKVRFLEELELKVAQGGMADFESRAAKYGRKSHKYGGFKWRSVSITDRNLDTAFATKQKKYKERAQKIERLAVRIVEFDRYDDFDLSNDPELWWMHITGKRPPGQLPGLRRWYDQHPGVSPVRDERDAEMNAVATAAAARELDELDYLS